MSRRKRLKQDYQNFNYLLRNNQLMMSEYTRLFTHYKNVATNLYVWENLPPGIESRHIEQFLFQHGQVFFTYDDSNGFLCLPCVATELNIYDDPTKIRVTSRNFSKDYDSSKGVRILNNDSALATIQHVDWFAKRMAHIESVMIQNLQQQRLPYIVATSKETELSVKMMMDDVSNGEMSIFMDSEKMKDLKSNIAVFSTNTPYLLDKLQQEKYELEREMLQFFGINTTIEKKERLLVDETNANNDYIEMNLLIGLATRQRACELINEQFQLNVSVTSTMHHIKQTQDESEDEVELETLDFESVEDETTETDIEMTVEDKSFFKQFKSWLGVLRNG